MVVKNKTQPVLELNARTCTSPRVSRVELMLEYKYRIPADNVFFRLRHDFFYEPMSYSGRGVMRLCLYNLGVPVNKYPSCIKQIPRAFDTNLWRMSTMTIIKYNYDN